MVDEAHEQIHVDASPARCFERASAFDEYPDWTNDVKQVTVLVRDADGRGTRVEYHAAALGRRVRYVLDYDFADAPHAFSWTLVEGDMLPRGRRPVRVRRAAATARSSTTPCGSTWRSRCRV